MKNVLLTEPEDIFREIQGILLPLQMEDYIPLFKQVYQDTIKIYMGTWPGFKGCHTPYHDIYHCLQVALASMRMVSGAIRQGHSVHQKGVFLLLMASLFHDIGFIAAENEEEGLLSGALHEERSVDFMHRYVERRRWKGLDVIDFTQIIMMTKLSQNPQDLVFRNEESRMLGQILGTADLLAQLGDRFYLEKLHYLYQEQEQQGENIFASEDQMYQDTLGFYNHVILPRLEKDLQGVYHLMVPHLKARYDIEENSYFKSMEKNMIYLEKILQTEDYQACLNRTVPHLDAIRDLEKLAKES